MDFCDFVREFRISNECGNSDDRELDSILCVVSVFCVNSKVPLNKFTIYKESGIAYITVDQFELTDKQMIELYLMLKQRCRQVENERKKRFPFHPVGEFPTVYLGSDETCDYYYSENNECCLFVHGSEKTEYHSILIQSLAPTHPLWENTPVIKSLMLAANYVANR